MYFVDVLNGPIPLAYGLLTYPKYRKLLVNGDPNVVAVGASYGGTPIGLALSMLQPQQRLAALLSLYVVADYRRLGVATLLLQTLENHCRDQCYDTLSTNYLSGTRNFKPVEALLSKNGWVSPVVSVLILTISADSVSRANWMYSPPLPGPYNIILWSELTPSQRSDLRAEIRSDLRIPPDLNPFNFENGFDSNTSMALVRADQVIGWLICHQIDEQTIKASCGWVKVEFQILRDRSTGVGSRVITPFVNLFAAAIRRGIDANISQARFSFRSCNPGILRFAYRKIVPYSVECRELKVTEKSLRN